MDNGFIFKTIFLLLIATATEAIFFDYPKKALMDFLHSLKEKKEAAKKSHEEIHHYHLHYYPVPVSLAFEEEVKISPSQYELNHLHSKKLRSLGWTSQEYKHVPEPEFIIPEPKHRETVAAPWSNGHQLHESDGLTIEDQMDIAAIGHEIEHHSHVEKVKHRSVEHHHQTHISLNLPFHQEIIVHPAPVAAPHKEEKPVHSFTAFFQKLRNIKNSLFSHNDDEKSSSHRCEDTTESPAKILASKLRAASAAYAIYFHPRNLHKF